MKYTIMFSFALCVLFITSIANSEGSDPLCMDQLPSGGCWKTNDIIDPRIEWHVQAAMMAMFERGGDEAADASAILCAVKRGKLGGIYRNSMKIPAQRAQSVGMHYWDMIPKGTGRNSACFDAPPDSAPLIVFRESIQTNRPILIHEIRTSWNGCRLERTAPRCYTVTIAKRSCKNEKWNNVYYACMGYKKNGHGYWDFESAHPELNKCLTNTANEWGKRFEACEKEEKSKGRKDAQEYCIEHTDIDKRTEEECNRKFNDKEKSQKCRKKANDVAACDMPSETWEQ